MGNFGVNFDEPFEAQAKALRKRLANQVPTEKWDDMLGEAHTKAFTVAGAMKADLLADLADAVGKSKGLKQFQEDFKGIVEKHGWDYNGDFDWRTRTIYMTNLRTSYAAGRLEQLQDYPLWMYKHSDLVTNPRQQHKAWSGLTLPADDPWWRSHYPPNGWGCQCRIIGVRGPKDVARYKGYIGEAPPIKIDPKTGAPQGIDRGWDYMPGYDSNEHQDQIKAKAEKLPPQLKASLKKDIEEAQAKAKYWDSSTEAGKWHDESFSRAPTAIKNAIKKHGDPETLLATPKAKPHFKPAKTIDVNGETPKTRRGQVMWQHEYGHLVDYGLGKTKTWSSGKSFTQAMQSDGMILLAQKNKLTHNHLEQIKQKVSSLNSEQREKWIRNLAEKEGIDYLKMTKWVDNTAIGFVHKNDRQARIFREAQLIQSIKRRDAQSFLDASELVTRDASGKRIIETPLLAFQLGGGPLSDYFSSITMKRIEGCASHSEAYFQKRLGRQQAESFANLFSILSDSAFGLTIAKKFTPKMLESMKGALT